MRASCEERTEEHLELEKGGKGHTGKGGRKRNVWEEFCCGVRKDISRAYRALPEGRMLGGVPNKEKIGFRLGHRRKFREETEIGRNCRKNSSC